ncbi:MAG: hypothetical protein LUQ49_01600, partial [Methanomicrobiales archaeon]|nr:hypothetical protein [Methanomicrobiales archaeon]
SEQQEVMKGVPLRTLLSELEKRRFTGYCAMPIAGASALLVLEEGKFILAEYRGIRGRDALLSIRSIGDIPVDVVIAPSNRDQVAAMRRMNEPFLVDPPRQPGSGQGAGPATGATVIRPVSIGGGPGKSVKVIAVKTRRPEEKARAPPVAGRAKAPAAKAGTGQAERLDRKGLEHLKTMRDSFKTDAADLLSELNLGHLVSNRPKSDKENKGEGEEKSGTG